MGGRSSSGGGVNTAVGDGGETLGGVGVGLESGSTGGTLESFVTGDGGVQGGAVVNVGEAGALGQSEAESGGASKAGSSSRGNTLYPLTMPAPQAIYPLPLKVQPKRKHNDHPHR